VNDASNFSRRTFLGATAATVGGGAILGALAGQTAAAPAAKAAEPKRKIKLGVIGLGGRGHWLAGLFRQNGGYDMHAVADYFPHVATSNGKALGVAAERCFSGLSGYKRVLESGAEAVVIIDVPYFYPEQAAAAVAAGLHVYMAKPVAVDVPGALSIRESAAKASGQNRVFLVDYQMPTDPLNAEVSRRVAHGGLGTLQTVFSNGAAGGGGFNDPPLGKTIESRLQHLIWVNDDALGCGYIGNYDIHVVDAVLRAVGRLPVAAYGWGAQFRPHPHGDTLDSTCVMYSFADGLVWNHQSPHGTADDWFTTNGSLAAEFQGSEASARVSYWGKAFVRGGKQHYGGGKVENLYQAGAVRNIATFYENVTTGKCANESVKHAVDSALVCILGREAAARRTKLTLDEVIRENKRLEVDLKGLKT
jgi:myo-inositol 2-dehydrogenase / D-chiro-inositol 1-dehydrogenase